MNAQTFDFSKTNQFSKLFLDYIAQKEPIREFQNYPPSIDGIEAALKSRKFNTQSRQILVTELKKQYENIETSPKSKANIENLLNDNTFTVTCGHQLNLFTGPLYFIYKIITTIKLAEQLKTRFPESNFVPIYWMASEDHDFEEINHLPKVPSEKSFATHFRTSWQRFHKNSSTSRSSIKRPAPWQKPQQSWSITSLPLTDWSF
jgi:uncharacterized protein YllA (UPF0747 family)